MAPPPERIARLFDAVADSYDRVGVDFFRPIAEGLVDELAPAPGERALDLGCGRGAALIPVARRLGGSGRALGGDVSPRMVEACRAAVGEEDLTHVEVEVLDAQDLDVAAVHASLGGAADLVSSSLVLFFLPEPGRALHRWQDAVRPGGRVGISTFADQDPVWKDVDTLFEAYLPPDLFDARTSGSAGPFETDAGVEGMFAEAGYVDVRTAHRQVSVRFTDPEHWYRFSMSVGQRAFWGFVPEDRREEVRTMAFDRLRRAAAPDGSTTVWQDVRYTLGVRP